MNERDMRTLRASVVADDAENELWMFEFNGLTVINITGRGGEPGLSVALDAPRLALVIAELSRRLHGMLAAELPLKSEEPAPVERPISEMSREEIREELGAALRANGMGVAYVVFALDRIEEGRPLYAPKLTPRAHALGEELHERAQKAAPT